MLHLAIICIVCAAFAPSDSTAFNGQKKNESNIFYNFEGGEQNIAKVSFPSVYNVVGRNSSDCAKPGITFFYDYFIKQYQNSKSNSCSIMERVPLGEDKNLHSNVDFVYRKRNLLWITDEKKFQPKTLRPSVSDRCYCSNRRPVGKFSASNPKKKKQQNKLELPSSELNFKSRWGKRKGRKKIGKADKETLVKADLRKLEKCTLSPKEKNMFLCLKRCRGQKDHKQKANLGTLQVDEDLDLNKRIKKLVEELAVENHRKNERFEGRMTSERKEGEIGRQNLKNEDEISPILNSIKQMFIFNKNNFKGSIVGNAKTDPVSSMRVRYPNPEKAENTVCSYDVLRTMRKTVRLRRSPQESRNSNECSKTRGPKYKNNLTGWSNPYSANFKANVNFLYPQRSRKFFPENTKKRRWMKLRMRRNRQKKGLRNWPILKRAFEKLYGLDTKPTCGERCSDSRRKSAAANRAHRSCLNITGTSQSLSLKDESVNCVSEGWKDSEPPFKILKSGSRVREQGESTTENIAESMQPKFPFYSLEKPFLMTQPRYDKLKTIKDIDKFVTEGPSTSSMAPQASNLFGGIRNHINPLRYLKFRHSLRDNTDHNKVEDPKKVDLRFKRNKFHGSKFSSANKYWRSAPVLCTSYIRNAKEDQLRYVIKLIQNVIGKPVLLKRDIFEQTKYKPSCGKRYNTPRDFDDEGEPNYPSRLPYLCNSPHLHSKLFQLFSHSRIASNSKGPYESVNVKEFQDNPLHSSSTLSPTTTLPRTTGSVPLYQPQKAFAKSLSPYVPMTFPAMERSHKIDGSSKEQVASSESSSLDSKRLITYSSRISSVTSPVPKFSSSTKAPGVMQANRTVISGNASTRTTPRDPVSTTTQATKYKVPRDSSTPPRPVSKPSTTSTSRPQVQPSTVNSHDLQESENQNENASAISSCKGEVCATMISHFSETPSEEPQIQQTVEEQVPSEVGTGDVCRAEEDNPTAVRLKHQANSESVDSQYRAPETNTDFKEIEMYNSNYLSRVGRSQNEKSRRKVEMIQKLFGNERREAALRNKRFHQCNNTKKSKSKSKCRGKKKKCNCWMRYFRKQYSRILDKSSSHSQKGKSKSKDQYKVTKPSKGCNSSSVEYSPGCSWQQQSVDVPIFSTPIYMNMDFLPVYDQQTQKIIHQPSDKRKQLESENQFPVFDGFHLDASPYKYALNTPPEEIGYYIKNLATKPPPQSSMNSQEQVYLKRQKRSDEYYVWPESDYGDYFYDAKYPEENLGDLPPLNEGPPETWTPPFYDMFHELAKAMAQTESRGPEEKKQGKISTVKPLVSPGLQSPATCHPDVTANCVFLTNTPTVPISTMEEKPSTPTVAAAVVPSPSPTTTTTTTTTTVPTTSVLTTTVPTTTVRTTSVPTTTVRTTSVPTTTVPTTTVPTTTVRTTSVPTTTVRATSVPTTTVRGRTRGKSKGGKKTYERFSKHSGSSKNLADSRDERERQMEEVVPVEEIHGPTTLRAAVLVRAQKKFQGKPSPKAYMKVFPDSFEKSEKDGGEALIATTPRTTETVNIVRITEQRAPSMKTDLRLQILAVCEGYLEVVKLIKGQNQTLAEDTDESLARYCENIISQNFNFQSEKCKKLEANELLTPNTNKKDLEKESDSNDDPELYEDLFSSYDSKASPNEHLRDRTFDNSKELVSKRKSDSYYQRSDLTSKARSNVRKRKRRRNVQRSSRRFPKLRRIRKKKDTEEDLEEQETGKQQKELIRLLRKRKKALLSWLLTANEGIKPDDLQETEYFDEEDLIDPESDTPQCSGTIKPRRDEKSYRTTQKDMPDSKETLYPVYAKDYGYESGGELIEVEVLWRQVNEKTQENKIFKNLSVLALFLTSTPSSKIKTEETKLDGDGNEIETETKWKKNKFAFDTAKMEAETDNSSMILTNIQESTENFTSCSGAVFRNFVKISSRTNRKNRTHTIISKPDPTSIVGAPTCANKTHRKISHKYGVAKDIFQEYSIEFLNYAVYILPVMFTILFFLCCLCCALKILKIQKSHEKRKKKKKKVVTSDDTSVSGTCETESKKRKRETKRKRNPASKENCDCVHKKKSKTFWNCLKVYGKPSRELDEENNQSEKKKSFLGFLKCKRDDGKPGYSSAPTGETDDERTDPGSIERKHCSDQYLTNRKEHEKHRKEEQREAAERRELIALLEELKKIETEHIEGKKEVKSVQVQYAIPEYDNSLFQPKSQTHDFSYPYEKNVFGMPKGICPFYNKKFQFHPTVPPSSRDYDLYEEVNELTKLLPWECYPERKDFLKHCDIKKVDPTGRWDRFLKLFRDSDMNCNGPVVEKKCKPNDNESRSFIFNKYRSINVDRSEELRGVSTKMSGTEVRLMEKVSPYKLSSNRDEDLVEDVENLKCQLNKKKYARLKDEGVLCRL